VLLIAFNRPDLVRRQLAGLRLVRPTRLFVAVDGPRPGRADDAVARDAVIDALDEVDWPCTVDTRLLTANVGLNDAVVGAIDWFFTHVDRGVILEDDCVPRPEFFGFAAELLERYDADDRVMHISGLSMWSRPESATSYVAARVGHIWGWATWRRSWERFDPSMAGWPGVRDQVRRSGALGRALARKLDAAAAGRKPRWARWWYASTVTHQGLALIPTVNLVRNDGLGPGATNTTSEKHPLRLAADRPLTFPLRHPEQLAVDPDYEGLLAAYHARSFRDRTGDRIAAFRRALRRQLQRETGAARSGSPSVG
jgi:hypothetical protein